MEVGVGGGKHINNLKYLLNKNTNFHGIDISNNQFNYLKKCFPSLNLSFTEADITTPFKLEKPIDLIFSNAVLMHIHPQKNVLKVLLIF